MMTRQLLSWFRFIMDRPYFQYLLLAGITLIALVFRFYKLGEWSFWFDEIFTVNRATVHYDDLVEALIRLPQQVWLPLSVLLTGQTLTFFGVSELTARLVPAVIGIVTIPILYFPIKRIFGTGVALISSLLLAVSPWHIYWSQNARFYTSLMLFYTLALFAFYTAIERNRPLYTLFGFILLYLATSERLFAFFLVPVFVVFLFFLWLFPIEKPPGLNFRNLALMGLLPLIALIVIEVVSFIAVGRGRFLDQSFLADIGWFTLYRNDDPFRLGLKIAYKIGLPLTVLGLFGGIFSIYKRHRVGLLLLVSAALPVLLLLVFNPFVFTKDRYAFITLPGWVILSAIAIKALFQIKNKPQMILVAGVLISLLADATGTNIMYYTVNNGERRDWRGMFEFIDERDQEGDLYVLAWPQLGTYYLGEEILPWLEVDVPKLIEQNQRVWFIIDSETEYGNASRDWIVSSTQLMEVRYLRTREDLSMRLYLYDPSLAHSNEE